MGHTIKVHDYRWNAGSLGNCVGIDIAKKLKQLHFTNGRDE